MSSVWLGGGISLYLFHPFLTIFECVAAASPLGLTISAWIGLALKSFLFSQSKGLNAWLGLTACIIQTTISVFLTRAIIKNWDRRAKKYWQYIYQHIKLPLLLVILPLTIWFSYIHYTHSLLNSGDKYYVGGTVYGDMPFHLMIINSFLFGVNAHTAPLAGTPVMAAFFADSPLVYPYIPDFHTALLAGSGASLHFSLMFPGILLCFSFLLLLFFLNLRLTSSIVAATLSVPLILMCGGTGGIQWLLFDRSWSGFRSVDHILVDSITRSISICWFSLPAHILLPQRTTQFAYPISLLALILIIRACKRVHNQSLKKARSNNSLTIDATEYYLKSGQASPTKSNFRLDISWEYLSTTNRLKLFAYGGLVTGLLPMLQAHSFVAVGAIMLVVAGLQLLKWAKDYRNDTAHIILILKQWGVYGVAAFLLGIPQSLVYLQRVSGGGFIRLQSIWSDFPPDSSAISLWFNAVGAFLPLFILSLYFCRFSTVQRQFQIGFFAVFFIANFMIFQPWVLDNTKVFYVWVFGAGGSVATILQSLWTNNSFTSKPTAEEEDEEDIYSSPPRSPARNFHMEDTKSPPSIKTILMRVSVVIIFITLILSGGMCMINESFSYDAMFDSSDVESAYWIEQNTPIDSRFAISTKPGSPHMRPEAALAGRQIMVSYWGWISNHGMPNHVQRNADINDLLSGHLDTRDMLIQYGIDYIVVDNSHIHDFNLNVINSYAYLAAANQKYSIYKVVDKSLLTKVEDCLPRNMLDSDFVVNSYSCAAAKCLWVPNSQGHPWCQKPMAVPPSYIDESRLDCGETSQEYCLIRGCIWKQESCVYPTLDHHLYNYPVTHPRDIGMPHLQQTRDCGWGGIIEQQCVDLGCVWEPNSVGKPWCSRVGGALYLPSSTFTSVFSLPSN